MDFIDSTIPSSLHRRALALDDEGPLTPGALNLIGDIFWKRYQAEYRAGDLETAISSYDRSVRLTPDFDPDQSVRLANLGEALRARFRNTGDMSDIDRACLCFEVSLLNDRSGERARNWMGNLGGALMERFEHVGDASELTRALKTLQEAADLIPAGHPDKPIYLHNLGAALQTRFEHLGDVSDLESALSVKRQTVELVPDWHPNKPVHLNNLGSAFQTRFTRLGDVSDLDMAVSVLRQALELTPDRHPIKTVCLANLGAAFQTRFSRVGEISDLEKAISTKRQAIELTLDGHPDKPRCLSNLGNSFETRFTHLGDVSDLERAISVQRQAVELTPDGHPEKPAYLASLGLAFERRFTHLGDISDLDMAISVKRQAVELTQDGHTEKPAYLDNLGTAFTIRFNRLGDASDLEIAVSLQRQAVELTPDGHPNKPRCLSNLGTTFKERFDRLGAISDLELAVSNLCKAVELAPDGYPEKPVYLHCLGTAFMTRLNRLEEASDLERAISARRQAVELTPDGHSNKPSYLIHLANSFKTRFERLGDVSDLEMAISVGRQALERTPDGYMQTPSILYNHTLALMERHRLYGSISDLEAAIHASSTAAQSVAGIPSLQFKAAQLWSELCETANNEQQTLRAYDCAIGLIPRVAWMGMAIEGRHRELERIGALVRNAAAAAVGAGDADRGLQWLEQGRSVVWSQILQQRSPLDLLKDRDSVRANRLTEISSALEFNAKDTASPSDRKGAHHRALVLEWDALVSEVRQLEGFEDFLGPKKVSQLLTAASHCPIVILNAHHAGCDALVLMAGADGVIHIPLDLNSQKAQELVITLETIKSQQSRGRKVGPADRGFKFVGRESYDADHMIKSMLAELWTSLVKPVLDALAFSLPDDDEDLPRICWCPTGPLAFLPIHAAGLYDTDERGTKVFDFVVSSYTPTVSALLQAPLPNPSRPKIFAVSQAEQADHGFSALPSTRKEVRIIGQRAAANSIEFTVAEDREGTLKHVLDEMTRCHWVHFACHGTQDLEDPTKSAFVLADGYLELSEIIKHPLPHAEFAFLSACQTATGDVKLAEEAVHLAAGMILAGYQSVIATMWSILDKDGPDVADAVYGEMLKDGKADHTRAAYALHCAVQNLRLSGAPFLAWMPFIHLGK